MVSNNNNQQHHVVYLTGGNGFLGSMIVKLIEEDDRVSKVYCPVRAKKDQSAKQRFTEAFQSFSKCEYVDPSDDLPEDTTHVILNAYNTRFKEPIGKKLSENVTPMVRILDQCESRSGQIQGITVVSTAYVQPPAPYRAPAGGRIPFFFGEAPQLSPFGLYNDVIDLYNKEGEEDITSVLPQGVTVHPYYESNDYAFSKHIMENLIHERYANLPIAIVRPSMIYPTRDGSHGQGSKAGIPLFMSIAPHPVMLAPRCEGQLNYVFVEDSAADCLDGALTEASLDHPIVMSTSRAETSAMDMLRYWAPEVKRVKTDNKVRRDMVRRWELTKIRVAAGARKAKLIDAMYENYDFFMSNTWLLEAKHDTAPLEFMECGRKFIKIMSEDSKPKKKKANPLKKLRRKGKSGSNTRVAVTGKDRFEGNVMSDLSGQTLASTRSFDSLARQESFRA
eukprot:CAMPEP_0194050136 /NCGR_PEP_ID=MMETSP0009_2-20130614/33319_1 /TAXON_ID=210454 /ORGANISM="Grammatophora oceanica, Strain CCMP 410" /LENGTH=447 /DNA_ID=CAMNT_0038696567 /DNA_START=27 /DNA_END=1370 /DNA_ORIENTATION=+